MNDERPMYGFYLDEPAIYDPQPEEPDGDSERLARARAIINKRGVVISTFKGKRCINTEEPLAAEEVAVLREAMQNNLI